MPNHKLAESAATVKNAFDGDVEKLRELARELGVGTQYWGFDGNLHQVATETLVQVMGSLGWTIRDEADLERVRRTRENEYWQRVLPASLVVKQGEYRTFPVHVPHGSKLGVHIELEDGREVPAQQGEDFTPPFELNGELRGQASFIVPQDLPLGWHQIKAQTVEGEFTCVLAVTPAAITTQEALAGRQAWGLQAQLYSVRSKHSWGIGDFADLRDLCAIAGSEFGADFTLVNPLHAAEPTAPVEASPYLPTTRRFTSALYVRIEDIPEYAYLDVDLQDDINELAAQFDAANRNSEELDRDTCLTAKMRALEMIYNAGLTAGRKAAFDAYCRREGEALNLFSQWCVLREQFAEDDAVWTNELINPQTELAQEYKQKYATRARFYRWIQFILDEQLASAQRAAIEAGMRIGVVHDLAVGVHPAGADSWSLGAALARGVHVGAPADQYNQLGQNWSQPPWRPDALAELGYAPFRDMLRNLMRHAGALRIDHILGLFRLWWIPEGAAAKDGTYVTYDHEAMIGVLALEAQRAGCIVVGEDLGTFEPWVRDYLVERGVLGTSILWFENEGDTPIPPENYRQLCMASVNTHDLPPTAGYLGGEHVKLRAELGLLERSLTDEIAADLEGQERVLSKLRERGLLEAGASVEETVAALHAYLAASPALLLGVSLVDCVGEYRIQNQPGTNKEYPNWKVPLADEGGNAVLLDELPDNSRMHALVAALEQALADKK